MLEQEGVVGLTIDLGKPVTGVEDEERFFASDAVDQRGESFAGQRTQASAVATAHAHGETLRGMVDGVGAEVHQDEAVAGSESQEREQCVVGARVGHRDEEGRGRSA